ncbi:unnamed protein product, partial [Rotaria magnacalcarata]
MILFLCVSEENISTIEHLRLATTNEATWEKVAAVKYRVKQMIRDYVQLNMASQNINEVNDPYKDSKATLLESFAQKIEQLSPSFTIDRQEDPSEFLQFLLDHLVTCLTPNKSMINVNLAKTPIEYIL